MERTEELREKHIQVSEALIARIMELRILQDQMLDEAEEVLRIRSLKDPDNFQWSLARRSEQRLANHAKELALQTIQACVEFQEAVYHLTPISLVQQVIIRLVRSIARDREIPF